MSFLFAPPAQPVIPVADERYAFFPVRRVFGIAKNYRAAQEPIGDPSASPEAMFFIKSPTDVTPAPEGGVLHVPYPAATDELIPEIELVACLGSGGRNLTPEEAQKAVWGWCVGIDFTRKDLRKPGMPWSAAKSFEGSAPVSAVRPAYRTPLPGPADVYLYVNNEKRAGASTTQMIRSAAEVIAALSELWTLEAGDIVFTGTPVPGAGPVKTGDLLMGGVNGVGQLKLQLV